MSTLLSPVARVRLLEKQVRDLDGALSEAALQIFKLRQEVTGGLQVIYCIASAEPKRTLSLNADDLITSMGAVRRVHNVESNTYSFIALTREEVAREKLTKINEQRVAIVQEEPTSND